MTDQTGTPSSPEPPKLRRRLVTAAPAAAPKVKFVSPAAEGVEVVKPRFLTPELQAKLAQEQEEAATRDFILRYFQKTLLNAEKVKTVRGKRSQFEKFQTALEPYYYQMSAANVALVQQLHDEALAKIGG